MTTRFTEAALRAAYATGPFHRRMGHPTGLVQLSAHCQLPIVVMIRGGRSEVRLASLQLAWLDGELEELSQA
jgi:hypothetical protein